MVRSKMLWVKSYNGVFLAHLRDLRSIGVVVQDVEL